MPPASMTLNNLMSHSNVHLYQHGEGTRAHTPTSMHLPQLGMYIRLEYLLVAVVGDAQVLSWYRIFTMVVGWRHL